MIEEPGSVSIFKSMADGSYFGEIDVIFRRRRNCNVRATTGCDAFTLSRTEFENIVVNEFPHIYVHIKRIAQQKEKRDIKMKKQVMDFLTRTGQKDIKLSEFNQQTKDVNNIQKIPPLETIFDDVRYKFPLEDLLEEVSLDS